MTKIQIVIEAELPNVELRKFHDSIAYHETRMLRDSLNKNGYKITKATITGESTRIEKIETAHLV